MTKAFESLPKIVKVILLIIFGWLIGGIYRIVKYVETPAKKRNVLTLVAGILALVTGIGNIIAEVCDIVTEVLNNKITILAD